MRIEKSYSATSAVLVRARSRDQRNRASLAYVRLGMLISINRDYLKLRLGLHAARGEYEACLRGGAEPLLRKLHI